MEKRKEKKSLIGREERERKKISKGNEEAKFAQIVKCKERKTKRSEWIEKEARKDEEKRKMGE